MPAGEAPGTDRPSRWSRASACRGSERGAATTLDGFTAIATAQSGRASFHVPGFAVVEEMADSGGPISQSAVDPSSAISFAAMPYPGDLVIAGPGLFAGLSGLPSPGNYPFYVSASHPTAPEQSLGDPSGYHLLAKAAAGSTSGLAKVHGQGGEGASGGSAGARSITSALVQGDTVTVTGETINEGLNLGDGALRIASVRSRSLTTYRAGDAGPVTKTEFVVEGGSAGASSFGYGPDGLVVAGSAVPIPSGTPSTSSTRGSSRRASTSASSAPSPSSAARRPTPSRSRSPARRRSRVRRRGSSGSASAGRPRP